MQTSKREEMTSATIQMRQTWSYLLVLFPFLGVSLGVGLGAMILLVNMALRWAGWVVR